MLEIATFVFAVVLLDVAALRWGKDSRPGVDDAEYSRGRNWRGFGGGK